MNPELRHVGLSRTPVVVIDDILGGVGEVAAIAAAMAPFQAGRANYYPGLRRRFGPDDAAANAYADRLLRLAAPFIGGAFDLDAFDLIEASFSMVTTRPELLVAPQRAPHFDAVEPGYLAMLHYLSDTPDTGTAFFRQRDTGIEVVDAANVETFIAAARGPSNRLNGYVAGSNAWFEEIDRVEARPDRLVIYPGALLHSGIIPPGMAFSADPAKGRLTGNLFLQGRRAA